MNKHAKLINDFRVFPRLYLTIFFALYVKLVVESWSWYTALDLNGIPAANLVLITAFPVALITALGGMFTRMYVAYQSHKPEQGSADQSD